MTGPSWVWGLPLAPVTRAEAADAVMELIGRGRPSYFITANAHYAMLTARHPELGPINRRAAFILADGAPMVWASRMGPSPLPERVAGSDLIFDLCERAAALGHGLFLLGAAEGVAVEAARRLQARYPGLRIVGTACPSPEDLSGGRCNALIESIRALSPDLLLVALGQPKGESWIADHCEALGVPACVQVGATLDFIAGRMQRAPGFYQKIGMEWAYRMWQEPARLFPRYASNAAFIAKATILDLLGRRSDRGPSKDVPSAPRPHDPVGHPS
jgi:N-acetylglucosaminyldiphosphoundecaprenol N-acetyl-beta-D-mannosaminyltransferase